MKDLINRLFNKNINKIHPKFWKTESGDLYLNFGEYGQEIEVACFSPDGKRVLCVKDVNQATIIDVESKKQVGIIRPSSPLEGSKAGPTAADFKVFIESAVLNNSGDIALLGLNDGTAGLFYVITGERLSTLHNPDIEPASDWCMIKAVALSEDNTMALVGFYNRSIGIWNVETKEMIMFLKSPYSNRFFTEHAWGRNTLVSSIAISSDNRYVFVGYSDMTAEIWDITKKEVVFNAFQHREKIIALKQYGDSLVWATSGGCLNRVDMRSKEIEEILSTNDSWSTVVFGKDLFLGLTQSYEVKLGSIKGNYEQLSKLEAVTGCARFEKDIGFLEGDAYYYPVDSRIIKIQSHEKEQLIQIEEKASFPIGSLASPSKKYMAIESDHKVSIYSTETLKVVSECILERRMYPLCISENDKYLVVKNENYERDKNSIYFWDISKGKYLFALCGHSRILKLVTLSPLQNRFVSADYEKAILWEMDIDNGRTPCPIEELNLKDIEGAMFLDESRILLVTQNSLELWKELKEKIWTVSLPFAYYRKFILSSDKNSIMLELPFNQIAEYRVCDGVCLNIYGNDFPRPKYCGQGYRWKGPGGPYLHQGEGPRGWITPQSLSKDKKYVVVQSQEEIVVANFDSEMEIICKAPLEGRLRASRILNDKVLVLNNLGYIKEIKLNA